MDDVVTIQTDGYPYEDLKILTPDGKDLAKHLCIKGVSFSADGSDQGLAEVQLTLYARMKFGGKLATVLVKHPVTGEEVNVSFDAFKKLISEVV